MTAVIALEMCFLKAPGQPAKTFSSLTIWVLFGEVHNKHVIASQIQETTLSIVERHKIIDAASNVLLKKKGVMAQRAWFV